MKPASIKEIKEELKFLPHDKLVETCLKISKFRKENKELITYILFESHDENSFIEKAKKEIDEEMRPLNTTNYYLAKKTIRKTQKTLTKFISYSPKKSTELELRIFFCNRIKISKIKINGDNALRNLYLRQVQRIETTINQLHEDLRGDYLSDLESLRLGK